MSKVSPENWQQVRDLFDGYWKESGSASFSSGHIQTNGRNQNRSLDDVLHIRFDVLQRHAIVETRHNQRAKDRPKNSSSSAHQACATDHACSNCVEFQQLTGVRRRATNSSGINYRSHASKSAHYAENGENMLPYADT